MNKINIKKIIFGSWKTNAISCIIVIIYLLILKFPGFLFTYSYSYKNLKIFTNSPIEQSNQLIDKALNLAIKSEVYNPKANFSIFLSDSHGLFTFFVPFARNAFGAYYPWISSIFINNTDLKENMVSRPTDDRKRSLDGVIAHELTHGFIYNILGYLKYYTLPIWIREGYSEYIANETTYSFDEGIHKIKSSQPDNDESLNYFLYAQVVKYLYTKKGITFHDLINSKLDWNEIKDDYLESIK